MPEPDVHLDEAAEAAPVWDIALPPRPSRIPGVRMAGFTDRGLTPFTLRALPHPAITLMLDLGERPLTVEDRAGAPHHGSLVAGLTPALTARGEAATLIQVRISPAVAGAVLGLSVADLTDAVVDPSAVWGAAVPRLLDRLRATDSWPDRFTLVEDWLIARGSRGLEVDPEVRWVWHHIAATRGAVRIDDLATTIGWSRKRLWARFRSQLGQPPKSLARLIRFDHAAHLLAAGDSPADAAARSGYVDQSHLHREVRAFSGLTPSGVRGAPWLSVDRTAWPQG